MDEPAKLSTWQEIRQWRKSTREVLLRARVDAIAARRGTWNQTIKRDLRRAVSELGAKSLGFYWPFRGEFDARPLVCDLIEGGMVAALPAVVQPKMPLEFRSWMP